MPAARESLLDAAYTALMNRPWPAVRMVDVAAAAGVSRQTLYNEFGSKEGLARALVRRETESYLAGVARALSRGASAAGTRGDAAGRVVAAAAWTLRTARANPLVRAASDRLLGRPAADPCAGARRRRAATGRPARRPRASGPGARGGAAAGPRGARRQVLRPGGRGAGARLARGGAARPGHRLRDRGAADPGLCGRPAGSRHGAGTGPHTGTACAAGTGDGGGVPARTGGLRPDAGRCAAGRRG